MRSLLLSLFCTIVFLTSAQESSERKSLNKARPKYVEFGLNVGHSYFRDLATSPIFSTGAVNGANFHYHRFDSLKESRFGFSALSGTHGFTIGNEVSTSTFTTLQLDYGRLFPFDLISNEHYKFKFGGLLIANFNIRSDQSLQNAGLGYEVVYNLMASAKVSRDVSRNTAKSGKFLWLIPYDWQPRKRLLSYQLNIGLVNANVRNGYAYVNQSGLTNEFPLFADYENNLFSGFRMNAALRYTIYLHNGNALRFSYVWDAYTTGGEVDQFELANHLFSAALLFDLSNW